jgi:hypothetical protein
MCYPAGKERKEGFMKKVLLVVAMLLVTSQVMASVLVSANFEGTFTRPDGNYYAVVSISYNSSMDVRAFALDINVDSGCGFWNIRDYNVGENNYPNKPVGYGIFPSRFRDFVYAATPDVCYVDNYPNGNYNPLAAWNEPGAVNTGIGFNKIVAEMGYLGALDVNKPARIGTLFRIDVNSYGTRGDVNFTVAADTMRGGIVAKDTNATTTDTNLPFTIKIPFPPPPPTCVTPTTEVGVARATAEAVWTTQGFSLGCGVGVVSCANLGNIITQDADCCSLPYCIRYTYGIAPTEPNVRGMTRANAVNTLTAAGFTIASPDVNSWGGAGVSTVGSVYTQNPPAGTQACNQAVTLSVVSYPIKYMTAANSLYVNWLTVGRPQCWAYPHQCHGDADGKKQGNYWVGTNDLAVYKASNNKLLTAIPTGGLCSDFDHRKQGNYWVGSNDLAIYKAYASKLESLVPLCGSTATTGDPNFWYWCLPTAGTCPTSPAGQVCAPAGTCPNTP